MALSAAVKAAEHRLSERNFARLTEIIHDFCGISMNANKRTLLESRLRRRMKAVGIDDINLYCTTLFDKHSVFAEEEFVRLIDAVTINKTDFFREPMHFELLQKRILPEAVAAGRSALKLWSAACSVGAEPYTLAMVADDFCSDRRGLDYAVLATDICTSALQHALSGRYSEKMIAPIPGRMRRKHLMTARDQQRSEFRMAPHLRSKIFFAQLNLMTDRYPVPLDFDAIFCRNVLIYFDRADQIKVLERLCGHLRPGGYLALGHSESIIDIKLPLTACGNTLFRRN
jgi:chemotaxis protein methyltransferase CheR